MTLAPSTDFGIRGHEGKAYDVNEICAAPGCGKRSVHTHHLWPRSYLRGQPYEWVITPDQIVIGNRIGLCVEHHEDVTGSVGGHKTWIPFIAGMFWWHVRGSGTTVDTWRDLGPLVYQPPGAAATPGGNPEDKEEATEDLCPTCGKPKHPKPHARLPPRTAKEWTINIPNDAEIGADVLDEWVLDFATILGFSDESSRLRRYHAVVTVMAWATQHRHEFVKDLVEATRA